MQDVKEYVAFKKQYIKDKVSKLERKPKIGIIQVNDDPASNAYIRGKLKDIAEVGLESELLKLDISTSEADLLKIIDDFNNREDIGGFIVQLPLPKGIDEEKVKNSIKPSKDVDGFHPLSKISPATPKGILTFLEDNGFDFKGKNAVVLGRSNIVGKPMAKLLTSKDMNVTLLHSKTSRQDMDFYIAHADLVIVAIGKIGVIDRSYPFKKSAVIFDVGINRGEDGKLHGDVEPDLDVYFQSRVPGGVGLLTRLALLLNLLEVYENGF